MTVISEGLLSRGQKVAKLVSSGYLELCRRCSASLSGYELPCLRLRWLSEVEIYKLLFRSRRL